MCNTYKARPIRGDNYHLAGDENHYSETEMGGFHFSLIHHATVGHMFGLMSVIAIAVWITCCCMRCKRKRSSRRQAEQWCQPRPWGAPPPYSLPMGNNAVMPYGWPATMEPQVRYVARESRADIRRPRSPVDELSARDDVAQVEVDNTNARSRRGRARDDTCISYSRENEATGRSAPNSRATSLPRLNKVFRDGVEPEDVNMMDVMDPLVAKWSQRVGRAFNS